MKTKKEEFKITWLGDLSEYEQEDAIKALESLIAEEIALAMADIVEPPKSKSDTFTVKAMTAKELKQEIRRMCPNCDGSGVIANGVTKYNMDEEGNPTGTYIEWEPEQCQWCDEMDRKLHQFCSQLCREQREICAETSQLDPTCGRYEEIINAPMPKL